MISVERAKRGFHAGRSLAGAGRESLVKVHLTSHQQPVIVQRRTRSYQLICIR